MDRDVAPRESAAPAAAGNFETEADVVVVGGGGGGLPAALFSRWLGNEVILLEKAPELGGTARKAAFWYWVPNNEPMRALGIDDREEDCLRYMARLSRPHQYDPSSPTLGLSAWEFELCRAIYQSASPATELLAERDALPYRHCADVPDYWAELPEDKAPKGRVLLPRDASETMSEQDLRIMNAVEEAGKALVIAYNKWDLVDEDRRYYLEREIDRDLVQFRWAPRVNISALTGRHMEKLVPAIEAALDGWQTRVPTGQLNAFLGRLVAAHPHPVRSGKQPKILFGTQAQTEPPTFVLFTSGKLDAGYERFIERRLREEFGFVGTPIVINVKPREKRRR